MLFIPRLKSHRYLSYVLISFLLIFICISHYTICYAAEYNSDTFDITTRHVGKTFTVSSDVSSFRAVCGAKPSVTGNTTTTTVKLTKVGDRTYIRQSSFKADGSVYIVSFGSLPKGSYYATYDVTSPNTSYHVVATYYN